MAVGRLIRTAIKFGPVAYPIIRKMMNKRKAGKNPEANRNNSRQTNSRKRK